MWHRQRKKISDFKALLLAFWSTTPNTVRMIQPWRDMQKRLEAGCEIPPVRKRAKLVPVTSQ